MTVTITTNSFPFVGTPAFYSGTGSTQLVPKVFPIAINGRPYMLDMKSNDFARQFDSRVRDSVDQSSEPGEAAINTQGLWRRSQSSWHYGAGQKYSDSADAEPYRFNRSKGINPWERGELKLLKDTQLAYSSSATNLFMATAGNRIYGTEGQTLRYTTDWSTFTTVTGTPAYDILGIASDGYNVYVSFADDTIYITNFGSGAATSWITNIDCSTLSYVKGRLMAAGSNTSKNKVWNITTSTSSTANNPSALHTHANSEFDFVDFAAGQNYIYSAGHAGNKSIIYKTQIKADGTALDVPSPAGELPFGEIVTGIDGYLGYILIGLSNGFRVASSDGDGNLVIGPLIETGTQVSHFSGIGKYVYFGWTNYDSESTGLGRIDLSVQVSANQPAYASDIMATTQGTVLDVHEWNNEPVFTISGVGAYRAHPTNLVSTGYLDTGVYRWGIPDTKFIPKWELRTEPLAGSVTLSVAGNVGADGSDGDFEPLGTMDSQGYLEASLDGFEDRLVEAEARLTLARSSTDSTSGPIVTRWVAKAYAAPVRSTIFSVPVLLHKVITPDNGVDYYFNVQDELEALSDLVEFPRIISYQEGNSSYSVVVEDVRWNPVKSNWSEYPWDWEGTCTVIMRSVR
jgi:hypothetical protein